MFWAILSSSGLGKLIVHMDAMEAGHTTSLTSAQWPPPPTILCFFLLYSVKRIQFFHILIIPSFQNYSCQVHHICVPGLLNLSLHYRNISLINGPYFVYFYLKLLSGDIMKLWRVFAMWQVLCLIVWSLQKLSSFTCFCSSLAVLISPFFCY